MTIGATAAWSEARPGRPRKNAATPSGPITPRCIWPVHSNICGSPPKQGLAICARHASLLQGRADKCLWPGCLQHPISRPLCTYHDKRVRALLEGGR